MSMRQGMFMDCFLKRSYVTGMRWHEPSKQFIAEIGYHEVQKVLADRSVQTRRVRTTHYLGGNDDQDACIEKFESIKDDWNKLVVEQRKDYDSEQGRQQTFGRPPLPRFKPNWPKKVIRTQKPSAVVVASIPQAQSQLPASSEIIPAFILAEKSNRSEILKLTIKEAYDRYVQMLRSRVGLLNGKGMNANTCTKSIQSLTLGLALNPTYSRSQRPIDVNKRLGDLKLQDYENYVHFWCNPANVKSERTAKNYTDSLRLMFKHLKVPRPDEFDAIFRMKITQPPKIVRYSPDLLKFFFQHENERVRLLSLMCLNFGYYQVDIARLKFEHITDFEGNPYQSGEMFITKRRERTRHQNQFTTTIYVWPETQALMEKYRAPIRNPWGNYFLTPKGTPYCVKTLGWIVEQYIRASPLRRQFSMKQFRKIGASQIKSLSGSDAMHQYKANALGAADQPYILEDFTLLTKALKMLREKLIRDGVLVQIPREMPF